MKLYKRNAQGKPIVWEITTIPGSDTITIKTGLVGGNLHTESIKNTKTKVSEYESRIKAKRKEGYKELYGEICRILDKKNYAHYFDIRTNHLNEKDWRRSFSINQFLYGIILAATADGTLHNSFDEIIPLLQKEYIKDEQLTFESEWR